GADASSAGMVDAGFENQKELTKMQLDNQKEIAEMQNETQKEIAGIQSATSRQNTKDQVYAQNEMLAYQQKESTARVASIKIGRAVQQECRDRSRMPSYAGKKKRIQTRVPTNIRITTYYGTDTQR